MKFSFEYLALGMAVFCLNSSGYAHENPQQGTPYTFDDDSSADQTGQDTGQFYPSYFPFNRQPLGHSRPYLGNYQQEGAYSQRAQQPFQQFSYDAPEKHYKQTAATTNRHSDSEDILGDGNFGVIKGGTFYPEKDKEAESSNRFEDDEFGGYFYNGHGRPSYFGSGKVNSKPYKQEQFADFKDFADINAPVDRQYSQYVVVYANQNETETTKETVTKKTPKNIIESLEMLDSDSTTETPEKKLSKSKRKLAQLAPEKKYKLKLLKKEKATINSEPLLALS